MDQTAAISQMTAFSVFVTSKAFVIQKLNVCFTKVEAVLHFYFIYSFLMPFDFQFYLC